jgi:hypothetical protein
MRCLRRAEEERAAHDVWGLGRFGLLPVLSKVHTYRLMHAAQFVVGVTNAATMRPVSGIMQPGVGVVGLVGSAVCRMLVRFRSAKLHTCVFLDPHTMIGRTMSSPSHLAWPFKRATVG